MSTIQQLKPAKELAAANGVRFPNESEAYRRARDALLAEEIELRRHIERVAEQRRGLPHTPILALTAHASQAQHEQCLAQGMDSVITKPVSLPSLLQAIGAVAAGTA